jgi:hypothetical protein
LQDDLRICNLPAANQQASCAPSRPRPTSLLSRLTRLAIDIFEAESAGPEFRPGGGYEAVIRDAASLVLDEGDEEPESTMKDPLDPALQSLFELMDDTVYDWAGAYGTGANPDLGDPNSPW